jgi:hypothetical protein
VLAPPIDDLPTDGLLRVVGHFDDPAAAGCRITFPETWPQAPFASLVQTRRCQERFVVTDVDGLEGP